MEDFKSEVTASPISLSGKTNQTFIQKQSQLTESIIASICGASLPAIIFYCFI
jgi:hypothetical protein